MSKPQMKATQTIDVTLLEPIDEKNRSEKEKVRFESPKGKGLTCPVCNTFFQDATERFLDQHVEDCLSLQMLAEERKIVASRTPQNLEKPSFEEPEDEGEDDEALEEEAEENQEEEEGEYEEEEPEEEELEGIYKDNETRLFQIPPAPPSHFQGFAFQPPPFSMFDSTPSIPPFRLQNQSWSSNPPSVSFSTPHKVFSYSNPSLRQMVPVVDPSNPLGPSNFTVTCPYGTCLQNFPALRFLTHVPQAHSQEANHCLVCPICSQIGYHYTVTNRTNLYEHIQRNHFVPPLMAPQVISTSPPKPETRMPRFVEEVLLASKNEECLICFEEFCKDDRIARLICLCVFHKHCLLRWFEKSKVCPIHIDGPLQSSSSISKSSNEANS